MNPNNPNIFRTPGLPPQYPLPLNRRTESQPAPITDPFGSLPRVLYSAGRQPRLPSGKGPQPLSPDNPHRFIAASPVTSTWSGQQPAPSPRPEPEQINSSTHPEVARANRKRAASELAAAPHIKRQRGAPGAAAPGAVARAPAISIDSPDAGDSVMQQASAELLCDTLFPPSFDNPLGLRNRHYLQRHTGLMRTLDDVFRSGDLRPGQSEQVLFRAFCEHGLRPANSGHLASLLREADMIWIYLAGPGRQATERQKSLFVVWSLSVSGEAGPRVQVLSQVAQAQRERLHALGQLHCDGFRKGLSALTQHCITSFGRDLCVDSEKLLEDLCAQGLPTVFAKLTVSAWETAANKVFRRKLHLEAGMVRLGDVVMHAETIIRRDVVQCFAGILCTALDAPDTHAQLGQGLGAFQNPESYTSFLEWVRQALHQYCQELVTVRQDQ